MLLMACPAPKCGPDGGESCGAGGGTAITGGGTGVTAGGSGVTGGGTGALTVEAYCDSYTDAYYDVYVRCGEYTREGVEPLIARQKAQQCSTVRVTSGIADGRTQLNISGVQACLTDLPNLPCTQFFPPSCGAPYTGLVELDGGCLKPSDCKTGSWCDFPPACAGACKARTAVGAPSVNMYGEDCAEGSTVYEGVCTALVAAGQSCAPTSGTTKRPCVLGSTCSSNNVCVAYADLGAGATCTDGESPGCTRGTRCISNVCTPLLGVDAACDATKPCKVDLQCTALNKCERAAVAGEPCGTAARRNCAVTNFYCDSTSGTCVARGQQGAACTASDKCINGLWCSSTVAAPNGTCQSRGGVNAACVYEHRLEACQDALYCTATFSSPNGVCASPKPEGAACADAIECASGLRCSNATCQALCAP